MPDLDDKFVRRIYQQFGPAPLTSEQHNLYVDLDAVRGNMDVVNRLEQTIRLAKRGAPTCQVLAGHKGSGKTTELLRLKKKLEDESGMFVVNVETDRDVDRNDVDFPDLLVAIVRQLAEQLRERAAIDLKPELFEKLLLGLKKGLGSEITFESVSLSVGLLKLTGAIKGSPDARAEVRKLLEPATNNWIEAANDVIGKAVLALRDEPKGWTDLVVLVDDLDKMTVRSHDAAGCNTDEYLFVNRAAQLTAFDCHLVYTMPLSLAYSHQEQVVKASYGGHVPVVPMTRVRRRPPSTEPDEEGVAKFREIIAKRLEKARAKFDLVFADEKIQERLIAMSGGQPTELMSLVREAIIAHGLPIDGESLDRAEFEGRREYARQLRRDHWPILEAIRRRGRFDRTRENEAAFGELLTSRAILQYVNHEEWYGLNPMVADLTTR